MPNALDVFREQREAAGLVYARVRELSELLGRVGEQVDAVVRNDELRQLLRDEQRWLAEAQRTVSEVRLWREQERTRFWPAMWRRWLVAVMFALVAAWAAGAGYAWAVRPYASELADLRSRAAFADAVERRISVLSSVQRRQVETLLGLSNRSRN